jgi:hypothetical protein
MPDDLVDSWAAPPRRETGRGGRGGRVALTRAVERWMPRVIGPGLVAASTMLVAGQLLSAYRMVWPTDSSGQFQLGTDSAIRVAQLVAAPFSAVPVLIASLPLLVLAGIVHLPAGSGLRIGPRLRVASVIIAMAITLVGAALLIGTAAWTLTTHGVVGSGTDNMGFFVVDPVSTFLSRGSDGLATAVLAGVVGWLLWTRSTAVPPAATAGAGEVVAAGEVEAATDGVTTAAPMPPPEAAEAAVLADPAYRLGSVVPGSSAPFVTRGASEPSWQHTDPTVFRRPAARPDPGPESTPEDDAAVAADPAGLFRRPVR